MDNSIKKNTLKSLIMLSAGGVLSTAIAPIIANTVEESDSNEQIIDENSSESVEQEVTFRNEEFFDIYIHDAVAVAIIGVGVPAAAKAIASVPVIAGFLAQYGSLEDNVRNLISALTGINSIGSK